MYNVTERSQKDKILSMSSYIKVNTAFSAKK